MVVPAEDGPVLGRLIEFLERLPFSPWWWHARWRRNDRQGWIRHVRDHYSFTPPDKL